MDTLNFYRGQRPLTLDRTSAARLMCLMETLNPAVGLGLCYLAEKAEVTLTDARQRLVYTGTVWIVRPDGAPIKSLESMQWESADGTVLDELRPILQRDCPNAFIANYMPRISSSYFAGMESEFLPLLDADGDAIAAHEEPPAV